MGQGYRDALAWLLEHGKVPLGFAGADAVDTDDKVDTADSASSLRFSLSGHTKVWGQSLQRAVGRIEVTMRQFAIRVSGYGIPGHPDTPPVPSREREQMWTGRGQDIPKYNLKEQTR